VIPTVHPTELRVAGVTFDTWPTGIVLRIPESSTPLNVTVSFIEPDAPVFGEAVIGPDGTRSVSVSAPDGVIGWETSGERAFWRLKSWRQRPVLETREQLLAGLRYRFTTQSFPEPGTPMKLRGQDSGWDLASLLRDSLLARVEIASLPIDPLWPRHLVTARRERVLSSIEAALVLSLYLNQKRFRADWVLVRPAPDHPGGAVSPAGYTEALVRVELDGEVRWMDPGCPMCGGFEIRPELSGASALGPEVFTTPAPTLGSERLVATDEELIVELSGPPALELRRWLSAVHPDRRHAALANRFVDDGELVDAAGLVVPGERVRVVLRADEPEVPSWSGPRDRGTDLWWPWVGTHTRAGVDGEKAIAEGEGWSWRREVFDGEMTETLTIHERAMSYASHETLQAARVPRSSEDDTAPDLTSTEGDESGPEAE